MELSTSEVRLAYFSHKKHFLAEISTDFDMEFSRTQGRGLAIVEMRQELRAFSVAFWMKVANSEVNPGTPLSYAVKVGGIVIFPICQ